VLDLATREGKGFCICVGHEGTARGCKIWQADKLHRLATLIERNVPDAN
jgi:hypothetical protein